MTIYSDILYWSDITSIFVPITYLGLITEFDFWPNFEKFPWNICNGCGIATEDAYSSGHLVLFHSGTCMCSNVETNLSWTCLVPGLLSFEHPSVLLFCFDVYFSFVWMHITLRFICENFTRISVKISVLWGPKYGEYAASSVSASVTSWC